MSKDMFSYDYSEFGNNAKLIKQFNIVYLNSGLK